MNYNEVNIRITPSSAQMNGEDIAWSPSDRGILFDLFQKYAKRYAKFYKMDTLSQLGFIATEILLQHYPLTPQLHDDCAIVFGNSCASIKNDKDLAKKNKKEEYVSLGVVAKDVVSYADYYAKTPLFLSLQVKNAGTDFSVPAWTNCYLPNTTLDSPDSASKYAR